jgi:hypothetical protein
VLALAVDGVGPNCNPVGTQDSSAVPAAAPLNDNTQADVGTERDNTKNYSKRKEKVKQVERKRKASALTHARSLPASASIGCSSHHDETIDSPIVMNQLPRARSQVVQVIESIQKPGSRQTRSR